MTGLSEEARRLSVEMYKSAKALGISNEHMPGIEALARIFDNMLERKEIPRQD